MRLPSRLKFGTHTPGVLPAWTESISRHLAVVYSRESITFINSTHKNDEVALEIDLPERRPFAPRCIHCAGRIGFVSRLFDDRIRLGMMADRMNFRARTGEAGDLASIGNPNSARSGRRLK